MNHHHPRETLPSTPPQHTMPTISPLNIILTEDQIDDLLYYSRTNDIEGLLSTLCTIRFVLGGGVSEGDILLNALDAESGNYGGGEWTWWWVSLRIMERKGKKKGKKDQGN